MSTVYSLLLYKKDFNRLRAIWPKGYQRGSVRKSQQNGGNLKTSSAKKLSSAGIEPAAFGLRSRRSGVFLSSRRWIIFKIFK